MQKFGPWRAEIKRCFEEQPGYLSHFFRRIETRQGMMQYYFQLIDKEAKVVTRSANYVDAGVCQEAAEDDSTRMGLYYDMQIIFTPHSENFTFRHSPISFGQL